MMFRFFSFPVGDCQVNPPLLFRGDVHPGKLTYQWQINHVDGIYYVGKMRLFYGDLFASGRVV